MNINHAVPKDTRCKPLPNVALAATVALTLATLSACVQSPARESASNPLPPTVVVQSQSEKIDLRGVSFGHNGAISASSSPVLDAAADLIKTQTDATVYVDAYCDPRGGAELNQKLSDTRAAAVKAYLVKRGVPADHLIARGFGATDFVANNTTREGRKENRRIELVIVRG